MPLAQGVVCASSFPDEAQDVGVDAEHLWNSLMLLEAISTYNHDLN